MMKFIVALAIASIVGSAGALPIARTAAGSASYGIHPGSYINGDFFVQACCGEPNVGDATEEWTSWSFDYLADPRYGEILSWGAITRAELRVVFRTGGDTPQDDIINGAPGVLAPFGFARRFSQYDVTLDLLALGAGPSLLAALQSSGGLGFQMGNDSSPYLVTLSLEGIAPVPELPTFSMLLLGLAGVWLARRAA